ncbi:MAG: hypothetical protein PHW36_03375 [Bacilli bacterium]|jgi:hypothetical protein|nr:hypothetical protein [Bacilli bacterium]MDD4303556.1 hypothetical protein [Bacilli bacterium]
MRKGVLILPLIVVSLAGCDPVTTDSGSSDTSGLGALLNIEVVSGLKEEYVQYEIVDQNEVMVLAEYENGFENVGGDQLTFDPGILDTSEIGNFDISISLLDKTVEWSYEVFENTGIEGIEIPDSVKNYNNNIKEQSEGNKRKEFMDRGQGYFVGDDNPFVFVPVIFTYIDDEELFVYGYHSVSTIDEKRGDEWVRLAAEGEISEVVAIDEYASSYDFTEAAIGKSYRLTVRPAGEQYALGDQFVVSFEFTVCEGFNVFDQDDLSHFDNVNSLWTNYRTEKGWEVQDIDGLILHNDIKVKASNIPTGFFYSEGDSEVSSGDADYDRVIGSLRDNVNLYHRDIAPGEDFVFNGNYFTINYSTLPYVVRESGRIDALPGSVISHATLIKAGYNRTDADLGDYTMKNLRIIGNANRTEEGEKSGGAIFTKLLSVDSHLYNLIGTQCFTFILTELAGPNPIIEKTRGYDSFSSMLYNWGTSNLQIIDSEFIGAGGPIIIADHVSPEADGSGGNPSGTYFINTKLESIVTGGENWFKLVHADAAVTDIVNLGEDVIAQYGTNSITKLININGTDVAHFNLIGVVKNGAASEPSSEKIRGVISIDDGVDLDLNGPFITNPGLVENFPPAMPRFQSSNGEMALTEGTILLNPLGQPIPKYSETQTNYFTGPYLNMYVSVGTAPTDFTAGYMGLVFGLQER